MTTTAPVLVFVHQPSAATGRRVGDARPRRAAFARATDGADVRVVASGHRHCSFIDGRAVWAPSLTLTAEDPVAGADPRPGFVEHVLTASGGHGHRVVRPWDAQLSSTTAITTPLKMAWAMIVGPMRRSR